MTLPPALRFGLFDADLRTGELRKAGVRVAIQEQPFRVLARLVEHPGELVTRDELRRELWPDDTFVDFEHGLNVAIKRLRDALGDDAEAPRFVETLPRRGYRFIAPVTSVDEARKGDGGRQAQPASRRRLPATWWAIAGVTAGAVVVSAVVLALMRRSPPVDPDGTILIADFVNTTGDAVFDGSLRHGLTVHFAQSPALGIVSREQVRETLKRMTRSADELVVGDVARDVCQRVGAKVTVNGTIAPLGQLYVIGLEAVDCWSGLTVAIDQTEASAREHVPGALGSSASRLRRRLGESLASIRLFDVPLEQATTSSIDALKAFSISQDISARTDDDEMAAPFLRRAIELDPDFAMAYAKLSIASAARGQRADEVRYAREAYARRHRASQAERFYIEGRHCTLHDDPGARGECSMKVHEMWARTYPRDWLPRNNLAAHHLSRGRYAKAVENGLEAIRLNPFQGFAYMNVIEASLALGRFEDAKRVTDEALSRQIFQEQMNLPRFWLAFVAADEGAMAAVRHAVAGTQIAPFVIEADSEAAAFRGRLRQARDLRAQVKELWSDRPWLTLSLLAHGALIDAAVGSKGQILNPEEHLAGRSFAGAPAWVVRSTLAAAALLSGDVDRATVLLSESPGDGPYATPLTFAARALLAARTGDGSATERLTLAKSRDPGSRGHAPSYLRGLAHLHAGRGREAAAEFQWILDHRGVEPTSPFYALAHLQHGRASRLTGNLPRARLDYETFLMLWKDADPDVPALNEARAEYANLAVATQSPH